MRRLREYLESHPYVNVVRFTTFFHLFTLVFDELRRKMAEPRPEPARWAKIAR